MKNNNLLKVDKINKIALFYYFALLDESRAMALTVKTLKKIKTNNGSEVRDHRRELSQLVAHVDKCIQSSDVISKPMGMSLSSGQIQFPEGSNWGPWFEFKKTAEQNDLFSVIWIHILKLPTSCVAEALGVSEGTIRHRVARGLRLLGRIHKSGGRSG